MSVLKIGNRIDQDAAGDISIQVSPKARKAAARASPAAGGAGHWRRYLDLSASGYFDVTVFGHGGATALSARPPALVAVIPPTCHTARTSMVAAGESSARMRTSRKFVEDDLEAQLIWCRGLKESGHVVDDAAHDGDVNTRRWHFPGPMTLAIIDRMLPKMDGLGVVAEMRDAWQCTTTSACSLSALSEVD